MKVSKKPMTFVKAVILIAILSLFSINTVKALTYCSNCREADSLALVALYNATDGINWGDNTNWLVVGQPIDSWYGVTLSEGRVIMLNLESNNLTGYLPNEIANLTSSFYIRLNDNYLTGLVTSGLASLSKTRISINNNLYDFTGIANSTIPSSNIRFTYYQQSEQPAPEIIRNGDQITLRVKDRLLGNQYFWYNNGNLIDGINSYEYTFIPESTFLIHVEIKNDLYPSLTLITEQLNIEISAPKLIIFNPEQVCSPLTVDITRDEITEGSSEDLKKSYFRDINATDSMSLQEAQAISISGTYYIKGTNDAGLSDIKPVEVIINSNPVVSGSVYDVTCLGGNNGDINISVSEGKVPYTFNWSTGVDTEDLSDLSEGSYQVTVTDANRCSAISAFNVNQNDNEFPIVKSKAATLYLDEHGAALLTKEDVNNGSTDNCEIVSIEISKTEFSCENIGDNTVTLTITDAVGNVSTGDAVVTVLDLIAPEITAPASVSLTIKEGEVPVVKLGNPVSSDNCEVLSVTNDSPEIFKEGTTNVKWTVADKSGNIATAVQEVVIIVEQVISNQLPEILSLTSNTPVGLGESSEMEAEFSDDNLKLATFDWGDGATSNGNIVGQKIYGTHVYSESGNYNVILSIYDETGESASMSYSNSVVDNSSNGHITGGGWINSAKGDYLQSKKSDKGNFGFEAKHDKKKGVKGNFTFHLNNSNFKVKSRGIEWLTIADDHALFAGSAEVNGRSGYEFLVSAVDVNLNKKCKENDLLRIIVWDSRGNLIYDNQQGSATMGRPVKAIGHGEIVIHEQKEMICHNFKSAVIDGEEESVIETALFENVKVFPNPAVKVLNIEIPGREEEMISYDIYDVTGRMIANNRSLEVWGQRSWIDLEELEIDGGMYVLKLRNGDGDETSVIRFMKR